MRRGVFEDLVHDLRVMLRRLGGRNEQPSAAIYSRTKHQHSPRVGVGTANRDQSATKAATWRAQPSSTGRGPDNPLRARSHPQTNRPVTSSR